jgi:hypothetical protein
MYLSAPVTIHLFLFDFILNLLSVMDVFLGIVQKVCSMHGRREKEERRLVEGVLCEQSLLKIDLHFLQ